MIKKITTENYTLNSFKVTFSFRNEYKLKEFEDGSAEILIKSILDERVKKGKDLSTKKLITPKYTIIKLIVKKNLWTKIEMFRDIKTREIQIKGIGIPSATKKGIPFVNVYCTSADIKKIKNFSVLTEYQQFKKASEKRNYEDILQLINSLKQTNKQIGLIQYNENNIYQVIEERANIMQEEFCINQRYVSNWRKKLPKTNIIREKISKVELCYEEHLISIKDITKLPLGSFNDRENMLIVKKLNNDKYKLILGLASYCAAKILSEDILIYITELERSDFLNRYILTNLSIE